MTSSPVVDHVSFTVRPFGAPAQELDLEAPATTTVGQLLTVLRRTVDWPPPDHVVFNDADPGAPLPLEQSLSQAGVLYGALLIAAPASAHLPAAVTARRPERRAPASTPRISELTPAAPDVPPPTQRRPAPPVTNWLRPSASDAPPAPRRQPGSAPTTSWLTLPAPEPVAPPAGSRRRRSPMANWQSPAAPGTETPAALSESPASAAPAAQDETVLAQTGQRAPRMASMAAGPALPTAVVPPAALGKAVSADWPSADAPDQTGAEMADWGRVMGRQGRQAAARPIVSTPALAPGGGLRRPRTKTIALRDETDRKPQSGFFGRMAEKIVPVVLNGIILLLILALAGWIALSNIDKLPIMWGGW